MLGSKSYSNYASRTRTMCKASNKPAMSIGTAERNAELGTSETEDPDVDVRWPASRAKAALLCHR